MNPLFTITTNRGEHYFMLFYLIAFLVCILIVLYEGYRRKYPMHQWLLIMASGVIFFIIGYKLFALSLEDWRYLIAEQELPATGKKTILGGLIGLIAGFQLAKYLLRFRRPVMDTLAVAIPISMAIQRVGCLMSGCCFGKPVELPWAVSYSSHAPAYHVHLDQGLIQATDVSSLSVHPTQLYHIIFCLIIAWMVWKSRKRWKATGNQLLFAILLYAVFRFFSEFFRDPAANFTAQHLWGLKYVQWGILAAILIFSLVIWLKERYHKNNPVKGLPFKENYIRNLLLAGLLILLSWIGSNWFESMEILTIHAVLFTAILAVCWNFYKRLTIKGYRWISPAILLLGIIFMSQTYLPENDDEKVTYTEIGAGGMISTYSQLVRKYEGTGSTCLGPRAYWSAGVNRKYSTYLVGMQISHHENISKYKRLTFKGGGFFGRDNISSLYNDYESKETTWGIGPYLQYDWKGVGFGVGFHLGSLRYATIDASASNMTVGEWENANNEYFFYPQCHLRLGPYQYFYIEGNLTNHFPSSSPMPYYSFGIGSGMGKVNGTKIGIGYSDAGYYLQAIYPIKERYVLEAFYADQFKSGYDTRRLFSVGFHYRFNFKTVPKKKKG